jgi:predicted Zn-dependent peptidase
MLLKPTFPQEELDILLSNKKQSYLVNNQKVGFIARNRFLAMIVGKDHPYGRYNEEQDFAELKKNDLLDFYEKNYSFDTARIIVSGKIEQDLIDKLEKEFGSIKIQKSKIIEKINYEEQPFHEHLQTIEVSSAVQNALRIGLKTIDKNHSDFHALKIVNTIFGGYFGSRLMTNIREDKGYTYGIGSGIAAHKNASFFFISSEVKSENSQDAIREILHELDVLQTKKIESEELMLVKNYIQGVFQRSFDGTFAQADRFKDLLLWNLDYNYYTEFIEKVKNIDESEIRRIASTYLKSESLFTLVVGKN